MITHKNTYGREEIFRKQKNIMKYARINVTLQEINLDQIRQLLHHSILAALTGTI